MSTVYFIDSRVQFDQALLSALPADANWYLIGPDEDGVAQMQTALTGVTGLDSIHIISHGDVGTLYLGSTVLNDRNLVAYTDALQTIGLSLNTSGDILLYGCHVGANGAGQQFIDQLALLSGADVAASTNTTGSGGDWILEAISGTVETASLSGPATSGALGTITGTNGDDTLTGGSGSDTLIGGLGNDTIDGAAGYNTYRIQGTIDAFYWSFNANGQMIVTDTITDGVDVNDGSNQGVDTLSNIQVLEFVNADGTVSTTFQVDDYSNAADPGNTQIQYGVWVNGRANYYGDTDWFKLDTVAGDKVVLKSNTNNGGYLTSETSNSSYLFGANNGGYIATWNTATFTALLWSTNFGQ